MINSVKLSFFETPCTYHTPHPPPSWGWQWRWWPSRWKPRWWWNSLLFQAVQCSRWRPWHCSSWTLCPIYDLGRGRKWGGSSKGGACDTAGIVMSSIMCGAQGAHGANGGKWAKSGAPARHDSRKLQRVLPDEILTMCASSFGEGHFMFDRNKTFYSTSNDPPALIIKVCPASRSMELSGDQETWNVTFVKTSECNCTH